MMDDSLILLANEVRAKTLWLLDGVTDEMARFTAPGLDNSILWHAGHALVVIEELIVGPATGRPLELPEGWFDKFGSDSLPRTISQWPPVSDVLAALRGQLPRLTAAIAALSSSQLDQIPGPPHEVKLRYLIVHALHDEANHQGEIWMLRKMYAKRMSV